MKFISLFAGVGGFDLGMTRAGHECVAMVEYDKAAAGVLAHRFPGVPLFCDVRNVSADDLPDADFLTYGFPCQDLSRAGKRKGLDGDRSGLFFEATRIIRGLRKRGLQFALAENVAGLLSADNGGALARCVRELLDCGARDVGWRTLDSQWFRVAQRRRRVFLVADFAGERCDEILALTESLRGHPAPSRGAGERVAPTVTDGAPFSRTGNERAECEALICRAGVAANAETLVDQSPTLISHRSQSGPLIFQPRIGRNGRGYAAPGEPEPALNGADAGATSDMRQCVAFSCKDHGADVGTVSPTLRAMNHSHSHQNGGGQVAVAFGHQSSASQGASVSEHISPCLDNSKLPAVAIERAPVRRLTPTECERLQGFPDDWTAERCQLTSDGNRWIAGDVEPQSDSARYKQMGNAVTVTVAEWIGQKIQGAMQ